MFRVDPRNHDVANPLRISVLMVDPLEGIPGTDLGPDNEIRPDDEPYDMELTDEDIADMLRLISDVKQGKMGPKWKKELENIEDLYKRRVAAMNKMPHMSGDSPKPKVEELLKQRDDDLDDQLRGVFDLSNLQHPTEEEISQSLKKMELEGTNPNIMEDETSCDSDDERYLQALSDGKLGPAEMKKLVNSFYREKGLLNEPVVRTKVGQFDVHWQQNQKTFDLWFPCISPDDSHHDYSVQFMPQELTITYKGTAVSVELRGKVDVDGCFWSMQKLPDLGKVVGIVLRKRSPKYSGTWEHIFRATPNSQATD
ncbi:hypothetical protein BaOVIS_031480 [Babesia ovis]|uniref:CS domain-containing protein n=1 Tax=Babesia ovis TaxID=5869 RepID=A0A9W5TCH5_BABOV|nr:hypothetical protein BaOVIS_031480 [Babesia ovis]